MARKSDKKIHDQYRCENCGVGYPAWQGKCDSCEEWSTIVEQKILQSQRNSLRKSDEKLEPLRLSAVGSLGGTNRLTSGISEFDRVLGGGLAEASVILLAGEPGVGKSTLLLQICLGLAAQPRGVLYISAEEVVEQVGDRARRVVPDFKADDYDGLELVAAHSLESIMQLIDSSAADVIVVDSIQTIYSSEVSGVQGGIAQVKYCAAELTALAKSLRKVLVIVGHINKDGGVAGPKLLEHLVDVVLQFSSEAGSELRVLRSLKNRFGPTSESGLFAMEGVGLREITNSDEYFTSENSSSAAAIGVCKSLLLDGNRPIVVELQALAVKSAYAYPKRVCDGIPAARLQVLVAALEKYAKLGLQDYDIYVNVARGLRIDDTGVDLALVAAIGSSVKSRPLKNAIAFGELNLSGHFSRPTQADRRVEEARRLGYTRVVTPAEVPHLKDLSQILSK